MLPPGVHARTQSLAPARTPLPAAPTGVLASPYVSVQHKLSYDQD
jgi:hypothetical protein